MSTNVRNRIDDLPGEIWREVPNSNGDYLVSTLGRVISKKYNKHRLNGQAFSQFDRNIFLA